MEESIDVKALRARFNSKASTSDTSSRDSGSPKSPRPGFGRAILPPADSELVNRQSPGAPPLGLTPGLVRFPRAEPAFTPPRPCFPRPPPVSAVRASVEPADANKVKQTGELLQNMMLRHQRPPGTRLTPPPVPVSAQGPGASPTATPLPLRQQLRQRSAGDVTPLRRPLPPAGPQPLKPKRPPNVNLDPFLKVRRRGALPVPRRSEEQTSSMSGSAGRRMSSPALINPPVLPQRPTMPTIPTRPTRPNKPSRLTRQIASEDIEDDQDLYDDIGSFDKNESCSENSSQCMDGDDDDDDEEDVYEHIDENQVNQVDVKCLTPEKKSKTEEKKQLEREKKEKREHQKRLNELKKNFQLQGEVEVLHTARARHDWHGGGKLDLSVRQGESVEIIRVKNNPGGKWLARSMSGNYGYISNTCVDIDYEAIKLRMLPSRKTNTPELPPPPPDPPQMFHMESNNSDSMLEDDDDYDDVQPMLEDFPPPPSEISMDPKMEKELRKKFKYEGPLRVLHCMMVNPNCIIKKLGSKDLHVTQGEIVDVIELNNSKKAAFCRNKFGKYGYVSRAFLLPMEGDVYDDVDYTGDIYDNDTDH